MVIEYLNDGLHWHATHLLQDFYTSHVVGGLEMICYNNLHTIMLYEFSHDRFSKEDEIDFVNYECFDLYQDMDSNSYISKSRASSHSLYSKSKLKHLF